MGMKIIGLTGSIATGKSTVADMCRHAGMMVHDADHTVHRLMGPYGKAVGPVLSEFGEVGDRQQGIDRGKLAQLVLGAPERRRTLEQIIHPLVREDRDKFIRFARRMGCQKLVLDVPLLLETGMDLDCDYVIIVWAPEFLIRKRALQRPQMTASKLDLILDAQMPQSEKRACADLWLPTGLGRAETKRRLLRWSRMIGQN